MTQVTSAFFAMPLKLSSITAKHGQPTKLGLLTILIGANNCGKSQTLRDIRSYVTTGATERLTILSDLSVELPAIAEGLSELIKKPHPSPGHSTYWGVGYDLQSREQFSPHQDWVNSVWHDLTDGKNRSQLLQHLGKFWIAHLNAESRFKLSESSPSFDTRSESPSNALQTFFTGGKPMQDELRTAFKAAFRRDIALDWAAMSRFYLKVGIEFGHIPDSREALDQLLRDHNGLKAAEGCAAWAKRPLDPLPTPDWQSDISWLPESRNPDGSLKPLDGVIIGVGMGVRPTDLANRLVGIGCTEAVAMDGSDSVVCGHGGGALKLNCPFNKDLVQRWGLYCT